MQVMPSQLPQFASWIPKTEKEAYSRMSRIKQREQEEAWVAQMLGDDSAALDRCFEVGARMLSRARGACRNGLYGMWSMYGTGSTCQASQGTIQSPGFARMRTDMYTKMKFVKNPTIPADVRAAIGLPPVEIGAVSSAP